MANQVKWQSYSYTFPKTGYVIYVRVDFKDTKQILFQALRNFVIKLDEIKPIVTGLKEGVETKHTEITVSPLSMLLKLKRKLLFPLEKSMWNQTGLTYTSEQRVEDFYRCLTKRTFYRVMIVPEHHDKEGEELEVAMPLPVTTKESELPAMMANLNYPVDQEATHAALYQPVSIHGFDVENNVLGDAAVK